MTLEKLLPTEGAHLGTRKKARDCQMSEYTSPYLSHTEPLDPLFTGIRRWLQTPSWRVVHLPVTSMALTIHGPTVDVPCFSSLWMRSITELRFSGKWAWKNRKPRRLGYSSVRSREAPLCTLTEYEARFLLPWEMPGMGRPWAPRANDTHTWTSRRLNRRVPLIRFLLLLLLYRRLLRTGVSEHPLRQSFSTWPDRELGRAANSHKR
jgi:hypothetical protein